MHDDFKQFNETPKWPSVEIEMAPSGLKSTVRVEANGPIFSLFKTGTPTPMYSLSILDYNIAMPDNGKTSLVTFQSIFDNGIIHKFRFKTLTDGYEACLYANQTSKKLIQYSENFTSQKGVGDYKGIVNTSGSNSPAEISITSIQGTLSLKISKIIGENRKAVFMKFMKDANVCSCFAYNPPPAIMGQLVPFTLMFWDQRKPQLVYYFIFNSQQIASDILLLLRMYFIKSGGAVPNIVTPVKPAVEAPKPVAPVSVPAGPTITPLTHRTQHTVLIKPNQIGEITKEDVKESVQEASDDDDDFVLAPAAPSSLEKATPDEAKEHHHHHHRTPEEKEAHKKKKAEKAAKKAKKEAEKAAAEAASGKTETAPEATKQAEPTLSPPAPTQTPAPAPAQTPTQPAAVAPEKKPEPAKPEVKKEAESEPHKPRISFQPTVTSTTTTTTPTASPAPEPATQEVKNETEAPRRGRISMQPAVSTTTTVGAEKSSEQAPASGRKSTSIVSEAPSVVSTTSSEAKTTGKGQIQAKKVVQSRRVRSALKGSSPGNKNRSTTRHRVSTDQADEAETTNEFVQKEKTQKIRPNFMPGKLASLREKFSVQKEVAKVELPSYETILGGMARAPTKMDDSVVTNQINQLDSIINEFDFDGLNQLPECKIESTTDVISDVIEKTTCINDSDITQFVPMDQFPDVTDSDFKYATTPSNPFLMEIMSIVEVINSSGASSITNDANGSRLAFLVAAILVNGLRNLRNLQSDCLFLDAFIELESSVSGLHESIEAAKAGENIGQQASLFANALLNNQCLIPTLREALHKASWIDTFYRPSAMIANYSEIDMILTLLTPLIISHNVDLTMDNSLLTSASTADLSKFVLTPTYPQCSFEELFTQNLTSEDIKDQTIKLLSSNLLVGFREASLQTPSDKLKKMGLNVISSVIDQKHDFADWNEFVAVAKEATKSGKIADIFEAAYNRRKAHIWFAFFVLSRRIMLENYFEDSNLCDFYKAKRTFTVLEHLMKRNE